MKIVVLSITSLILAFGYFLLLEHILYGKRERKTKKQIGITMVLGLVLTFLSYIPPLFRTVFLPGILICYSKLVFDISLSKIILAVFYLFLLSVFLEIILQLLLTPILSLMPTSSLFFSCCMTILNMLFSLFFIRLSYFQKIQKQLLENSSKNAFLGIVIVLLFDILFLLLPNSSAFLSSETILFGILLLVLFSLSLLFFLFLEIGKQKQVEIKYQELLNLSSSNQEILEQQRILNHENRNELYIIRSMVREKEALKYIDTILQNKQENAYLITDLWYLPFPILRGLLSYKITTASKKGIHCALDIYRPLKNLSPDSLTPKQLESITKILGVFLDNAIEEVEQKEDKEKEIDILLGLTSNQELFIKIANPISNVREVQKRIAKKQTSKGAGHGYGLLLVEKILKKHPEFVSKTEIIGELFVQNLTISWGEPKAQKKRKRIGEESCFKKQKK